MSEPILTVAMIRAAATQLKRMPMKLITYPKGEIYLTVGGVVSLGNGNYMHPYTFRDTFGPDAYRELLARPRIVCEYD